MGALDTALVLLVVEGELEAHAARVPLEVLGLLVGVGAVGGQQPDGQAEWDQGVERTDGVGADVLAGRVQDSAQGELRVLAHPHPGVLVAGGVSAAGRDQEGRAVTESALGAAAAEVPARRGLDGGEVAAVAWRVVPGSEGSGVGADVTAPALEESAPLREADGDQHETVADLLQQGPAPHVLGVVVLPGGIEGIELLILAGLILVMATAVYVWRRSTRPGDYFPLQEAGRSPSPAPSPTPVRGS